MDMMSWINKMDKTFLPTKESISFFSIRILITKIVELKESIIDSIIISNKFRLVKKYNKVKKEIEENKI
jgi:hypothetical protein